MKLEGGVEMAETVAFLTQRGVPVIGHVGLTPQAVNTLGGYRSRGKDDAEAEKICQDARAIADAGAFALVIEGTREDLAAHLTETLPIPTIGIGASPDCDGQILVVDDLLGMFERAPRFVKQYATLRTDIAAAVMAYVSDIKTRRFPAVEHCFARKKIA